VKPPEVGTSKIIKVENTTPRQQLMYDPVKFTRPPYNQYCCINMSCSAVGSGVAALDLLKLRA
jgi:hypothetical protein